MNNHSSNMRQEDNASWQESELERETFLKAGDLCSTLLPIWANQLSAAREITNSSIESLSQRFSDLSKKIETTASISTQPSHVVALLKESQSELSSVISLLHETVEDKKLLVNAIVELSSYSKELNGLASVVSRIAKETNMVAINAAIEAAHIGQHGRGFAVVAESVRRLSADAEKTGINISDAVNKVTAAIVKVEAISSDFKEKDTSVLNQSESAVEDVIAKFDQAAQSMLASTNVMESQAQFVKSEIAEVLVSLQFQDRVSQMLTHVENDVYKLHDRLLSNGDIDNQLWLKELADTYTTKEQHLIHKGKPFQVNQKTSAFNSIKTKNSAPDDITFF